MPTEVYSILSHGAIGTAEVLDHKARNRISIVSIGTEGEITYASPTLLLVHYFLQKYGNRFMTGLLDVLMEHGTQYIKSFKPDDTPLQKDIRLLFDVNAQDLKRFPSNVLRAYYGQNTIVNTDLFVKFPHETIMYRSMFKKDKFDKNDAVFFAGEKYSFETMFYSAQSLLFNLISPFGLLRFDDDARTFGLMHKIPVNGATLKDALDYIHQASSAKNKVVFMVCCKGLNEKTMMDFDIKEHPLETIRERTLADMMGALKLDDTTEKALRPRKLKLKTKVRVRKRKAATTDVKPARKKTKVV